MTRLRSGRCLKWSALSLMTTAATPPLPELELEELKELELDAPEFPLEDDGAAADALELEDDDSAPEYLRPTGMIPAFKSSRDGPVGS